MKYFVGIFVFIIVLFFYLHINHHLTKSNDLEVYTIEKPSKDKLDEICNLRQPIIFDYNSRYFSLSKISVSKLRPKPRI